MSVHQKLAEIQSQLKAPKNQTNNYGKYNYRSCEDILEAVKPLANKYGCAVTISDTVELIGNRYYIKSTATLIDSENGESVSVTGFAREQEDRKGMDDSQVTGSASSYARKYALNGLFSIDDTKDADTMKPTDKPSATAPKQPSTPPKDYQVPCPVCGKISMGTPTKDGGFMTGKEVVEAYGECTKCYKAHRNHAG